MIGSTKTILHALPLLAAAVAGSASAAPRFQFPFAKEHHPTQLASEGEIDLSKYTIGQILNYTLHHRGPHDGEHDHDRHPRDEEDGDEHRHPRGPPLFKLAYIVNRTESVRRLAACGPLLDCADAVSTSTADQGLPERPRCLGGVYNSPRIHRTVY